MKALICINLKDNCLGSFKNYFEKTGWDNLTEVHFVHGFEVHVYADNFLVTRYPMAEDLEGIRKSVISALEDISSELVRDKKVKVFNHCVISESIKADIVGYADEMKVDEILAVTKKKGFIEGLFSSSFAEYLLRHAHCPVVVLRDQSSD